MPEIPAIAQDGEQVDIDHMILQTNAFIRFYFKENPDLLSDQEYAVRIKELTFLAREGLLRSI